MYTQRQAAKLSGVAQAKLSRLKAKGVIVPDLDGDKYSAELVEKIRLEYGKNTGINSDETVTADDTTANVDDTATSAQEAAQATIDAVDDQTPADVQNAVKNDDSAADMSQKKTPPINFNHNGTQEYYTPSKYIEAARRVFGGTIDLDPASCALANETVKAEKFFSIDDDGLSQKWHGRIWMNPPYDKNIIPRFIDKLLTSDIEAAIVLVPCRTDRPWFKALANFSNAIVFSDHRVKCLRNGVDDDSSGPTCGSAIFYIGDDVDKFFTEFEQFGFGVYPRKKNTPVDGGQKGYTK